MSKKVLFTRKDPSRHIQVLIGVGIVLIILLFVNVMLAGSSPRASQASVTPTLAQPSASPPAEDDPVPSSEPVTAVISQADIDSPLIPTAGWQFFELPQYGVTMEYPLDFLVQEPPSRPAEALSSFGFTPKDEDFRSSYPAHLLIYQASHLSLLEWFEAHSTTKPFDDPSVSMRGSPYYFRQYSELQEIRLAGQPGFSFSSMTMFGRITNVILSTPDQAYILYWSFAGDALLENDTGPVLKTMLGTLKWIP
jgi:hypothetical protein